MRKLLVTLLATIALPTVFNAKETCNFVSEYYPDVTIEVDNLKGYFVNGFGNLKYKNKPMMRFHTGISNGYGGQYFHFYKLEKDSEGKDQYIKTGKVVSIIGDQVTTGTPKDKRKSGKVKVFFPDLGSGYYYSLSNYSQPEKDGRFGGRTKAMTAVLKASDGFFVPDKICKEKFVYYRWD